MNRFSRRLPAVLIGALAICYAVVPVTGQTRDFSTQRLILDDNGSGGSFNRLMISTGGDIPNDRVLRIQDPGTDTAEFLLAVPDGSGGFDLSHPVNIGHITSDVVIDGVLNVSEIETENANETLRLNPSGDLVQIGNSSNAFASNGLDVYGRVDMYGGDVAELHMTDDDIQMIAETVTINGNLVVNGHLTVQGTSTFNGRISANASANFIGSSSNAEQLRVRGASGGSADHLYVIGNVRLTNELRLGTGSNTSRFKTGTQAAEITYTLPTALPAAAATGTSMGSGMMETDNTGAMSWRNMGTAASALDFPSTADGASSDLTLTVTGAETGDLVVLGIPNGSQPAGEVWYQAWVSAADTVTVRLYNASGAAVDPASGSFNVMVVRP